MDPDPCQHARQILKGLPGVGDDSIGRVKAKDSGESSALSVVQVLDEVLNSPFCPPALWKECLVALPALCATYGVLPSRYSPTGRLTVDHQSTTCVGGADVRPGILDGLIVIVKSIPYNLPGSSHNSKENAYKEAITWKNLNHPNILPLLGVDRSPSSLSTISPRMQYGSLREYLADFPDAPRAKLLLDASRGLEYMHGLDCIHGDLKASNIVVNDDHSAVLTNFRLASFLTDTEVDTGVSISECDTWSVRWLAPELLFPEEFGLESAGRTKETDVYGFAMVMFEVFSGSFPFEGIRNEASILRIRSGDHPNRPKNGSDLGLTDELWKMMKVCWKSRDRRWKISHIASALDRHSEAAAAEAKRR